MFVDAGRVRLRNWERRPRATQMPLLLQFPREEGTASVGSVVDFLNSTSEGGKGVREGATLASVAYRLSVSSVCFRVSFGLRANPRVLVLVSELRPHRRLAPSFKINRSLKSLKTEAQNVDQGRARLRLLRSHPHRRWCRSYCKYQKRLPCFSRRNNSRNTCTAQLMKYHRIFVENNINDAFFWNQRTFLLRNKFSRNGYKYQLTYVVTWLLFSNGTLWYWMKHVNIKI